MAAHEATLECWYDTGDLASLITESVAREVGEIDDGRSQTTIDRQEDCVTITIEAADPVALRAALNTWLTLVDVAEQSAAIGDAV